MFLFGGLTIGGASDVLYCLDTGETLLDSKTLRWLFIELLVLTTLDDDTTKSSKYLDSLLSSFFFD